MKYTEKHLAFLKEHAQDNTLTELTKLFNNKFNVLKAPNALIRILYRYDIQFKRKYGYTKEHLKFFRKQCKLNTFNDLLALFNKSFNLNKSARVIRDFLNKHKLRCVRSKDYFSEDHIDFLKQNSNEHTTEELSTLLKEQFNIERSKNQIRQILFNYKIEYKRVHKPFAKEEIEFLREKSVEYPLQKLKVIFNEKFGYSKTAESINRICKANNIKLRYKSLSNEEIAYILENYKTYTIKEVIEGLETVFNRAYAPGSLAMIVNKYNIFKLNKYSCGDATVYNLSRENKNANFPLKRVYIKTEGNKWILEHNRNWEEVNGKLPKKMHLIFIDGDYKNTSVENLKLVSRNDITFLTKNACTWSNEEELDFLLIVSRLQRKINLRKKDDIHRRTRKIHKETCSK
jgi:transposase